MKCLGLWLSCKVSKINIFLSSSRDWKVVTGERSFITIYTFFLFLLLLYKSKTSFCISCWSHRACLQSVCGGAGKEYQSKIGLSQFVLVVYYQNVCCFVSCTLKAWCIFKQYHAKQFGAVVWHTAFSYLSAEWQQKGNYESGE